MDNPAERLAELHWISFRLMIHARGGEYPPTWAELDVAQRNALVAAMETLLVTGHIEAV